LKTKRVSRRHRYYTVTWDDKGRFVSWKKWKLSDPTTWVKPPVRPPPFMFRVSVAVNAPVSFKYDPRYIPRRDVPIKRKYYGFLFQEFSLRREDVNVERAFRECIEWTGKALKKLSLGYSGWPAIGYSVSEWWFSFTVGREFPVKIPVKRGLSGTWLFQVEGEDGSVVADRRGRL